MRIGVIGVGFGTTVHIPAFISEGLDVGYYNSLSEIPLDFTTTNKLTKLGLIKLDKGKLKTTNRGKLLTDQLIKTFLC